MSRTLSTLLALTVLMLASICNAESKDSPYVVLEPGATWTYEYRFWEEGRFAMEQVGGNITWIEGITEWGGHQYYRLRTKTTGFQNVPDLEQLVRVTGDSVRTLQIGQDPSEEVLVLPLPAVPGRTWSVAEGDETWHYILESAESVEVPAGRFEGCIAIMMTLKSKTSKFDISSREERCAGVGKVRLRTWATHKYGVSNGEYTLLEFKP